MNNKLTCLALPFLIGFSIVTWAEPIKPSLESKLIKESPAKETKGAASEKSKYGTAAEAEQLVTKAAMRIMMAGTKKAYAEFTEKKPGWVDRDLYIVVYDLNGVVLAHGLKADQVGKNLYNTKDPDGKEFVKERVELSKSKGRFWHDYKFLDPSTKEVLPKRTYCELIYDQTTVCSGIYKR